MYRLLLILLLCPTAFADHITIGTFTYLGGTAQSTQFQAVFNTTGVTAGPLSFILALGNQYGSGSTGYYTTPVTVTFASGVVFTLPCPCLFASLAVEVGGSAGLTPIDILLANGQTFNALGTSTSTILPLPGQTYIQPGQSVPIVLTSVPEPATGLLLASGLACAFVRRKQVHARWR